MTHPLDDSFPCLSPASAHPREVPLGFRQDEVKREIQWRRAHYGALVNKGRLTEAEMHKEIGIFVSIAADFDADRRTHHPTCARFKPDRAFSWEDKIRSLRRELAIRRAAYPRWIAKGRMTEAEATQQIERLEAVHWMYWREMFAWLPPEGIPPDWNAPAYRAAIRAHLAQFETADALEDAA